MQKHCIDGVTARRQAQLRTVVASFGQYSFVRRGFFPPMRLAFLESRVLRMITD
jgi:hypothetical protein